MRFSPLIEMTLAAMQATLDVALVQTNFLMSAPLVEGMSSLACFSSPPRAHSPEMMSAAVAVSSHFGLAMSLSGI
jgi:hypothetical protein